MVNPRANRAVIRWIEEQDEHRLFLSVMTIGELQKGIARLSDGPRRNTLESWISEDLTHRFRGRILQVDTAVAVAWGRLLGEAEARGKPLPVVDVLIAATARVFDCVVVTRNVKDLEPTGVEIMNPWD